MTHVLKCWPGPFVAVADASKPFEFRKEDDRRFAVGDTLILLEWSPHPCVLLERRLEAGYSGEILKRRVTYVLREAFGVPDGYAVLGLGMPSASAKLHET